MSKSQIWQSVPYEDLLRDFFGRKPKDVDGVLNTAAIYYKEYLLKKLFGRFAFENIPDDWDHDYMLEALFLDGYFCITETEAGILPLRCGLTGINVFNHPTTAVIANPVLGNFDRVIDVSCALIQLQASYTGVYPLLNRYSVMLAMCDSAISVNLMNTKATFIFGATSKAQAETFKALYDDISCGKPASFIKDGINEESFFTIPAKQNFVAEDVQILKRKIVDEFLTEIGINNANLDKRERLTDDEVNANDQEVIANIQHWIDNVNKGVKRANELFDLDIKFVVRDFGGDKNESSKSDRLLQSE